MRARSIPILVLSLLLVTLRGELVRAQQHQGGAAPTARPASMAPGEAEQFAFLVGSFEVTVMPKVNSLAARIHGQPKLLGTWKGWRAFDGFGIEDELRIIDASGNPASLTHTMRLFDAAQGKWTQTTLDVYRGRFTTANGTFRGGEVVLRGASRDPEGKPVISRVRFYDITATGFKSQTDRSYDGERTWDEAVIRIEATRVSASAPR